MSKIYINNFTIFLLVQTPKGMGEKIMVKNYLHQIFWHFFFVSDDSKGKKCLRTEIQRKRNGKAIKKKSLLCPPKLPEFVCVPHIFRRGLHSQVPDALRLKLTSTGYRVLLVIVYESGSQISLLQSHKFKIKFS